MNMPVELFFQIRVRKLNFKTEIYFFTVAEMFFLM